MYSWFLGHGWLFFYLVFGCLNTVSLYLFVVSHCLDKGTHHGSETLHWLSLQCTNKCKTFLCRDECAGNICFLGTEDGAVLRVPPLNPPVRGDALDVVTCQEILCLQISTSTCNLYSGKLYTKDSVKLICCKQNEHMTEQDSFLGIATSAPC